MSQQGLLSDSTTPAPDIEFITGDSGGAVGPDGSGNINLLGNTTGMEVAGNPGTNTLTVQDLRNITKYVVDATAGETEYTTIQAALDAANTAGGNATVYVRPGTYTEDLTLYDSVDIRGTEFTGVTITGTHTPPASGRFAFYSCTLTDALDIFNSAVAGTADITVQNCEINVTNGYLFNLLNWTGNLLVDDCANVGTNDGFVNNTGGSAIFVPDSTIGAGTGNTAVVSGNCEFYNARIRCPITMQGAGTSTINGGCWLGATLTTAATATVSISNSLLSTGTNAAISHGSAGILDLSNITINTTNATAIAGAGAGIIFAAGVEFVRSYAIAGGLTLASSPRHISGGIQIAEDGLGSETMGAATLAAGSVLVSTTEVTANSRIFVFPQSILAGTLYISARVAGVSFTITSTNGADVPSVAWLIVEPK